MYRSRWSWSGVWGGRCSIHQGIYDRIFQITRPNIQYGNHSMLKPNGWICFVFLLRRANKLCDTASAPRRREVFKKPLRVSCIKEAGYPSYSSTCITFFRKFCIIKVLVYRDFIFEKFWHIYGNAMRAKFVQNKNIQFNSCWETRWMVSEKVVNHLKELCSSIDSYRYR